MKASDDPMGMADADLAEFEAVQRRLADTYAALATKAGEDVTAGGYRRLAATHKAAHQSALDELLRRRLP